MTFAVPAPVISYSTPFYTSIISLFPSQGPQNKKITLTKRRRCKIRVALTQNYIPPRKKCYQGARTQHDICVCLHTTCKEIQGHIFTLQSHFNCPLQTGFATVSGWQFAPHVTWDCRSRGAGRCQSPSLHRKQAVCCSFILHHHLGTGQRNRTTNPKLLFLSLLPPQGNLAGRSD